jgi:hypothetical protein
VSHHEPLRNPHHLPKEVTVVVVEAEEHLPQHPGNVRQQQRQPNFYHATVQDHRAKNDNKFQRLSDIPNANNFTTSKDMCAAICLNASKCIMWGLYCSCKGKCRTAQQTNFRDFKLERALEIMLKASKAINQLNPPVAGTHPFH